MTAKETYRQLQRLVDEACLKDSFLIAITGAESLGMKGGRVNRSIFTLDYEFEMADESGSKVKVQFHSYDQSKAFDIQPDMNKFTVTLTHPAGISEVHTNEYEG